MIFSFFENQDIIVTLDSNLLSSAKKQKQKTTTGKRPSLSSAVKSVRVVERLELLTSDAARGPGFESYWRRDTKFLNGASCTEPFMFTLPSTRNVWTTDNGT